MQSVIISRSFGHGGLPNPKLHGMCGRVDRAWVSGMIVPPEDPDIIELAIRTALSDDCLVNQAAAINWQIAEDRLEGVCLNKR